MVLRGVFDYLRIMVAHETAGAGAEETAPRAL